MRTLTVLVCWGICAWGSPSIDPIRALLDRSTELQRENKFTEAETVLRAAIKLAENTGDSENAGLALSHLGNLYSLLGQADEARVSLSRAIRIWMSNGDEPNNRLIRTAGDLMLIYRDSGDAASADRFWTKTLQPMLSRVDSDTIEFAGLLEQHGMVYVIAKRYGKAEPLLTRAIAIREQKEPGSEDLAVALTNRAAMRLLLHRPGEALTDLDRALAIVEKAGAGADSGTAIVIGNMGVAYFEQHRYAEADLQFSRALRILAQWPVSTHGAEILKSYAKLLQKSGRKGEARQMELRVSAILQKLAAEPREERIDASELALSPKN